MAISAPGTAPAAPAAALVRAELDRILASQIFSRSDRLTDFLKFVVEETLNGRGETLKEHTIAIALYGKGPDFMTAADPIVRVDARRLRDHLREFYASAASDGVVISVPKGSYAPVFEIPERLEAGPANIVPPPATVARRSRMRLWIGIGALAIAAGVMVALARLTFGTDSPPPTRLLTVTSFPGAEEDPSFSPDGSFVTFSWSRTAPRPSSEIWVKSVDGDAMRQVTHTADALDKWPEWSPDGQYIAFTRLNNLESSVLLVSPYGGPERLVSDAAADAAWLPDAKSLVMVTRSAARPVALVSQVLATGARRQLIVTDPGFLLTHPRVSPDGQTVMYAISGEGRTALFVIPLGGGQPRRIGDWHSGAIGGQSWSPDGRDVVYARPESSGRHLVRVPLAGNASPQHVAEVPVNSVAPALSRVGARGTSRLAFVSGEYDVTLRMLDLEGARQNGRIAVTAFCDSTRQDSPGRFSPDGTRVAFVSNRGGSPQVWVAGRDESSLSSVTNLQDATVSIGSWSPDGRWVAFDATIGGNADLYVARADGGAIRRLTNSIATEIDPEWSRDGQWIYYSSNASGSAAIWKMAASGGTPVRLTSDVGFDPRESPDGKNVYFVDRNRLFAMGRPGVLKRVSEAGGVATTMDIEVPPGAWDVTDKGIVFAVGTVFDAAGTPDVLAFYDFTDRRVRQLGRLDFRIARAAATRYLAASRDGRSVLVPSLERQERDIMVLDNFR